MKWRDDRGDLLVTPAVLMLGIVATLVVGGLVFFGARSVAPRIGDARQGQSVDDEGNVVEEGIGVAPFETTTPEPTETPTAAPTQRPVVRTATPTQAPVFIAPTHTQTPHETEDPHETEEPHDTPEPEDTPDPDDQHPN
jgi:hypothetical protein